MSKLFDISDSNDSSKTNEIVHCDLNYLSRSKTELDIIILLVLAHTTDINYVAYVSQPVCVLGRLNLILDIIAIMCIR